MSDYQDAFLEWLEGQELPRSPLYDCPYLPNKKARQFGFASETLNSELYQALLNRAYRRTGTIFYGMDCPTCQLCVPLRVPVATFAPSKSQRRTLRKNLDLRVEFLTPQFERESYEVYHRYLQHQHPDTPQDESEEHFREALYGNVVDALEARYYLDTRLVGVSLLDVTSESLSSVYHFFEPEVRQRRIGVFSVIAEIAHAKSVGIPYYHLGYWVQGAPTMHYKADFGPNEVLKDGVWHTNPRRANADDNGAN